MYERMLEKIDKSTKKTEREKRIADDFKVFEEVFDRSTLLTLHKFMAKRLFDEVCGTLATGKEANVYIAKTPEGKELALKIFRISTTDFKTKWNRLASDPRFSRTRKDSRQIIFQWARREYANMREFEKIMPLPHPIDLEKNVLVMEFLGRDGIPYPRLKDVGPSSPARQYKTVLSTVRKMYRRGFVHADMSEYNILVSRKLYFIDFSQATVRENPNAEEFLERDVANVNRYFSNFCDVMSDADALDFIKGD